MHVFSRRARAIPFARGRIVKVVLLASGTPERLVIPKVARGSDDQTPAVRERVPADQDEAYGVAVRVILW